MELIIIGLAVLTFIFTLTGGMIALKHKKNLPYFFAFAAGTLVSVAFLDLLPESLTLTAAADMPMRTTLIVVVSAFFVYSLLERFFPHHEIDESHGHNHGHIMGPIGAGSLTIHSFLDGVAIGAAFQVNQAVGLIVALAVLFHDFTDGINTVTIMLKNKQKEFKTKVFLIMDAVAPILGVLLTTIVTFSQGTLAIILAIFVGEFIYIGVASLLPETYHDDNPKKFIIPMALGIVLIIVLTQFLTI